MIKLTTLNDLERNVRTAITLFGSDHVHTLQTQADLARALLLSKKFAEAKSVCETNLSNWKMNAPNRWSRFHVEGILGAVLLAEGDLEQAEKLLLSAQHNLEDKQNMIPSHRSYVIPEALQRLVELYQQLEQPTKSATWQQRLDDLHQAK